VKFKEEGIVQALKYQFLTPNLALAGIEWFEQSNMLSDDGPVGLCVAY